jgi:hypothetical protein
VQVKHLIVVFATVAFSACSLDKQAAPALTGPSESGLAVTLTASPNQITRDGQSTSIITLKVSDANGQPVAGLSLRGDIAGDNAGSLGALSSKSLSTDAQGAATVVYTSAPPPPPTNDEDVVVTLEFTPNSSNFSDSLAHSVNIRLIRPGVITLPGPTAAFTSAVTGSGVHFDASASTAISGRSIVSYDWDFGDGTGASGRVVDHSYQNVAGQTIVVTLRVTDSAGQSATTSASIKF